jgi:hypothetical protein
MVSVMILGTAAVMVVIPSGAGVMHTPRGTCQYGVNLTRRRDVPGCLTWIRTASGSIRRRLADPEGVEVRIGVGLGTRYTVQFGSRATVTRPE